MTATDASAWAMAPCVPGAGFASASAIANHIAPMMTHLSSVQMRVMYGVCARACTKMRAVARMMGMVITATSGARA